MTKRKYYFRLSRRKVTYFIFKNPASKSLRTYFLSVMGTNLLIMFREMLFYLLVTEVDEKMSLSPATSKWRVARKNLHVYTWAGAIMFDWQRKSGNRVTFSIINPTSGTMKQGRGFLGEKQANNCLSYGTTLSIDLSRTYFYFSKS